jgi:hypothetical protein
MLRVDHELDVALKISTLFVMPLKVNPPASRAISQIEVAAFPITGRECGCCPCTGCRIENVHYIVLINQTCQRHKHLLLTASLHSIVAVSESVYSLVGRLDVTEKAGVINTCFLRSFC